MKTKKNKQSRTKKRWIIFATFILASGIVCASVFPFTSMCSAPIVEKADFTDKVENIKANEKTEIATINFANVDDPSLLTYELTSSDDSLVHLDHIVRDGKYYITAQSKPLIAATASEITVEAKILLQGKVIGQMSQTLTIDGHTLGNIKQPKNFKHVAGTEIPTLCSFDIPAEFKDTFKDYTIEIVNADTGIVAVGYTGKVVAQNMGETLVSCSLESSKELLDQTENLKVKVHASFDWLESQDQMIIFESDIFVSQIIHFPYPSVEVKFLKNNFSSYEVSNLATIKLVDIDDPESSISFDFVNVDSKLVELKYLATNDTTGYIQMKSNPVMDDKTFTDSEIVVKYNGVVVGRSAKTTWTLTKIDVSCSIPTDVLLNKNYSKSDYLTLTLGSGGVASLTDFSVQAHSVTDDALISACVFTMDESTPTKIVFSFKTTTVLSKQNVYYKVTAKYKSLTGADATLELHKTKTISIEIGDEFVDYSLTIEWQKHFESETYRTIALYNESTVISDDFVAYFSVTIPLDDDPAIYKAYAKESGGSDLTNIKSISVSPARGAYRFYFVCLDGQYPTVKEMFIYIMKNGTESFDFQDANDKFGIRCVRSEVRAGKVNTKTEFKVNEEIIATMQWCDDSSNKAGSTSFHITCYDASDDIILDNGTQCVWTWRYLTALGQHQYSTWWGVTTLNNFKFTVGHKYALTHIATVAGYDSGSSKYFVYSFAQEFTFTDSSTFVIAN